MTERREATRLGGHYFGVPLGIVLTVLYWERNHGLSVSGLASFEFLILLLIGIGVGYTGGMAFGVLWHWLFGLLSGQRDP